MNPDVREESAIRSGACSGYIPGLDGLRCCAFLLVLVWHVTEVTGWFGVDLFFVLSGFLITRILLATREEPQYFSRFYLRRALRIFPAYYAFLIVCGPLLEPGSAVWFYTYTSNFLIAAEQRWVQPGHLWSLAIEEQFYLLWPLLLWRIPQRWLLRSAIGSIVVVWIVRIVADRLGGAELSLYVLPWFRFDAFAWGGALAVAVREQGAIYRWIASRRWLLMSLTTSLFLGGVGIHPFKVDHWYWPFLGSTNLYILAALIIVQVLSSVRWQRVLEQRVLRLLGRVSYGLYLWHLLAVQLAVLGAARIGALLGWSDIGATLGGRFAVVLPLSFLLTIGFAVASWYLIERPFLRLKDRIP